MLKLGLGFIKRYDDNKENLLINYYIILIKLKYI
jgi:hypothetical protein